MYLIYWKWTNTNNEKRLKLKCIRKPIKRKTKEICKIYKILLNFFWHTGNQNGWLYFGLNIQILHRFYECNSIRERVDRRKYLWFYFAIEQN